MTSYADLLGAPPSVAARTASVNLLRKMDPAVEDVQNKPRFSSSQAMQIASQNFGNEFVSAKELPSERDQNFVVSDEADRYVLKIANPGANRASLQMQVDALRHLQSDGIENTPTVYRSVHGDWIPEFRDENQSYTIRLVNYVEGREFADIADPPDSLLDKVGRLLGRVTKSLQAFEHAATDHMCLWDLNRASETIETRRHLISDPERRELVDFFFDRYQQRVVPHIDRLRKSIIHNDANDHNLVVHDLISADKCGVSLIDFGDMLRSSTVNDLAICLAYVMLGRQDPLAAAAEVVRGFQAELTLQDLELTLLFDLACARLCTSLAISTERQSLGEENEYLLVTQAPAWQLLDRLRNTSAEMAEATFRQAAGFEPVVGGSKINDWLAQSKGEFHSVTDVDLRRANVHVLDLSVAAPASMVSPDTETLRDVSDQLFAEIRENGGEIGIGRYNEPRACYQSEQFLSGGGHQSRTIHLGIDLFLPAGSRVYAPLDGVVHGLADNDLPLDYGPTVILKHQAGEDGPSFYTLYGHLSRASLPPFSLGQVVVAGQPIGALGDIDVNGGWVPHLHFQCITAMLGYQNDFPGVAPPDQRDLWLKLCPDPNLVLGIDSELMQDTSVQPDEILAQRKRLLGPSLSLSYREPLQIVRGSGQFLFDHEGRSYLDLVNNVCHVGHCHPKVVAAAAAQTPLLNTNTRYLHPNIVRYAEKLVGLFPDPLQVCFFVNSGSEANDLALRMARTATSGTDMIVLDAAYHGNLSSLIEVSPYKFDGAGGKGRQPRVHVAPMPDGFRGNHRYDDAGRGSKDAGYVTPIIETLQNDGLQPAGFIGESLLGCGGQIELPEGYLTTVYETVRRAGGLCIADEVQVGFGRVGSHFWGFETQNVVPDIVTLGKPIGNGHPLGAVVTTREIAEAFANGMEYFNTFGGNPVSSAIGLSVLDVIEQEQLQERALRLGTYFKRRLSELAKDHSVIGDVRGRGLFLGVEMVEPDNPESPHPVLANYVVERMKAHQILLSTDGPDNNVLKIKPPLVLTQEDIDRVIEQMSRVLAAVQ